MNIPKYLILLAHAMGAPDKDINITLLLIGFQAVFETFSLAITRASYLLQFAVEDDLG